LLRDAGAEFEEVDLSKGLTEGELDGLIGKRDYRLFLNSRNELFRERGMKKNPPPRAEAIRLMAAHPNLLRRPLYVSGGKLVVGYDESELKQCAS
jgi:arsenate reductase-like glutaredoxin family protein